jgi:hypothetical protein
MYKILGADGKEYGPVSLEQMRQWVSHGRVNAQTKVQAQGSSEWRAAAEIPEIQAMLANPGSSPGSSSMPGVPAPGPRRQGLAITSFVLGLFSILCLGILTGIPAIFTGHRAHNRARKNPSQFGGSGLAIAGFIMGYVSVLFTLVALAIVLPALAKAKEKAQEVRCANNLRQIGTALQIFAMDHDQQFPFSVSSDSGGTLEQAKPGEDGFATDPVPHFKALAEHLGSDTGVLVCPEDNKTAASSLENLQSGNITYRLRAVPGIETNLNEAVVVCPIHNTKLMPDGSVQHD